MPWGRKLGGLHCEDEMNRNQKSLYLLLLFALLFASGCAHSLTTAEFLKKIDEAGYSKINEGSTQHFTAIRETVFDRQGREISHTDSPKMTVQIANHGNIAYSIDSFSNTLATFRQYVLPSNLHSDWDKYYVWDVSDRPNYQNYISFGSRTVTAKGIINDGVEYGAAITDSDSLVHYTDTSAKIEFKRAELPPNSHADWDKYYVDDNFRYGLSKSSKKGLYALSFTSVAGEQVQIDFMPVMYGYQSTQKGAYRAIWYLTSMKIFYIYDFLPTKKLICLDLARVYDKALGARNKAVAQAVLKGILIAIGGFAEATYAGTSTTTYNGYYSGQNWTATGTSYNSGYAQAYDYSYLASGAINVLDAIFKGNASLDQIESALEYHGCGLL